MKHVFQWRKWTRFYNSQYFPEETQPSFTSGVSESSKARGCSVEKSSQSPLNVFVSQAIHEGVQHRSDNNVH
jgi:hypothetical protein